MNRVLAVFLALALAAPHVLAHEGRKKNTAPTKAAADLKNARLKMDAAKAKLAKKGRYLCCIKPSCDVCARTNGSCLCGKNVLEGKGACGECYAAWMAGRGALKGVDPKNVTLLPSPHQAHPEPVEPPAELEESLQSILRAKRLLVSEKRYNCCIKGGCDECAHETDCPCGGDLNSLANPVKSDPKKPATGPKGVCGSCLDGWHAGKGAFAGLSPEEIPLARMEEDMEGMNAAMSPGLATSGWYTSGTSQMPRSGPMFMLDGRYRGWTWILGATGFLVNTQQSGPRGEDRWFGANYIMPMATRKVGPGYFTLRTMLSLEPATVRRGYYPLLFQSGETAKGIPIVDGQHPHDFFMELAASYQWRLSDTTVLNFYGGPRGDPAIGPPAYPHRLSASENPMAALAHHYQDSTHIASNVATVGVTHRWFTLEASGFHGGEPNESRWNLDGGRINSYSSRITFTPRPSWSFQFSGANIAEREILHPGVNTIRYTASAQYTRRTAKGWFASTLLWGQNRDTGPPHDDGGHRHFSKEIAERVLFGRASVHMRALRLTPPFPPRPEPLRDVTHVFNSGLAEATWRHGQNWLWGRFEIVDKPRLLEVGMVPDAAEIEEDPIGKVASYTMGYSRELPRLAPWLSTAIGGQMTLFQTPHLLRPQYGKVPVGVQVFLRVRLTRY